MSFNLIVILGATATGKTSLAASLAVKMNTEIISGDSRQVFRGLDIGSGKDLNEYKVEKVEIPYHLIDIVNADQHFSLYHYQQQFDEVFKKITQNSKNPILCGGSGLYIEAAIKSFEYTSIPVNQALRTSLSTLNLVALWKKLESYATAVNKSEEATQKRLVRSIEIAEYLYRNEWIKPQYKKVTPIVFGIELEANLRRERIKKRLSARIREGLVEEVQDLLNTGITSERLRFFGLEYKFVADFLEDKLSFEEMEEQLYYAICQFSKRQMTYFRKMEKDGLKINWLDGSKTKEELLEAIDLKIKWLNCIN